MSAAHQGPPFGGKLGFGKTPALILIDFVRAYFDHTSSLYAGVDDALVSALRLRDLARRSGTMIIYTRVQYQADGSDGGTFFKKVPALQNFVAGSPMSEWAIGVYPANNELVITKQYASAFFGTSLAATLTANRIDTVILTGLTTSGCVRATCVDAVSHGFIPIVVSDACGDRHEDPHNANLFDMSAKYADVVSEADIHSYLNQVRGA